MAPKKAKHILVVCHAGQATSPTAAKRIEEAITRKGGHNYKPDKGHKDVEVSDPKGNRFKISVRSMYNTPKRKLSKRDMESADHLVTFVTDLSEPDMRSYYRGYIPHLESFEKRKRLHNILEVNRMNPEEIRRLLKV